MNTKSKFSDLRLGEPFLYNGIVYTKASESEGLSQRLGFFVINPDETVESVLPDGKPKDEFNVLRFAFMWAVVMGALYLIGEFCL